MIEKTMHFPYDEVCHRMGIGWEKTQTMGKVKVPIFQVLPTPWEETTNSTDLNTFVMKTSNVDFTIEKSNKLETDLSNNTDKKSPKSEKKQVIRKNNDIKTQKSVIILIDSMIKYINGWDISTI